MTSKNAGTFNCTCEMCTWDCTAFLSALQNIISISFTNCTGDPKTQLIGIMLKVNQPYIKKKPILYKSTDHQQNMKHKSFTAILIMPKSLISSYMKQMLVLEFNTGKSMKALSRDHEIHGQGIQC